MTYDKLFNKPASEWTDAELQAGVRAVIDTRNAASTAGDLLGADAWNNVLYVLANERSTRTQLYQQTREAVEYGALEDDTNIRPISDLLRLEDDDEQH
ncbi:MAG TPA: hypothetical protein VGJ59_12870 [Jatrophihabitantaceae bacterium]